MIDFISLGNANDIGASCHYLGINGTGVVLDVGADPNEDGPATLPDFLPIINREIDHVFVTHAHHDHIGSLPALNEKWPMARLHLTPATRTLTISMLYASARLQQRKFDEGSSPFRALFDEEDLEDVLMPSGRIRTTNGLTCSQGIYGPNSITLDTCWVQPVYFWLLRMVGAYFTPVIPVCMTRRLFRVGTIPQNRLIHSSWSRRLVLIPWQKPSHGRRKRYVLVSGLLRY